MKVLIKILIIITLSGCGYQPIYVANEVSNVAYQYSKITLEGDKMIGNQILNLLPLKENKTQNDLNELIINSNYIVEQTSKDTLGKASTFRTTLTLNLLTKKGNINLKQKEFFQSSSYGKRDNNFELLQYQNNIKKNMINTIADEINLYLKLE